MSAFLYHQTHRQPHRPARRLARRRALRRSIAAGLALALLLLPTAASAETRRFDNPRIDGLAVDHCLAFNSYCDWEAAHDFCSRAGFGRATDWTWAYKGNTRTLGTNETCTAGPDTDCGGFIAITCSTEMQSTPGDGTVPFSGASSDYAIYHNPATGTWTIYDTRPGAPDGAQLLENATTLQFQNGSVAGPGAQGNAPTPATPPGTTPGQPEPVAPPVAPPAPPPPTAPPAPPDHSGALIEGTEAPMPGSGTIRAELAEAAHNCKKTGPSPSRRYTICDLSYTLTNTSGTQIYWTSGEWQTARPDGSADRRGVGYPTAGLLPGKSINLKSFCVVPTGHGQGNWAAWGAGHYYGNPDENQFVWRVTAFCP